MIERQVTARPVDTFVQASKAGVMKAEGKQRQTQQFFQSLGAFTKAHVEDERAQETEQYNHVLKLQGRSFNSKLSTMQSMLSKPAYRDYTEEQLMETPEYKAAIQATENVVDKKAVETFKGTLKDTLTQVSAVHTNAKAQETMDSLVFDALDSEVNDDEFYSIIEDGALTVGHERALEIGAIQALSSANVKRVEMLLDQNDARMSVATKGRLLSFKTQAEAEARKAATSYKADIGRLSVHLDDTKDPDIGYKMLELMRANGDEGSTGYGKLQGKIDLYERRKGNMALASNDVVLGATNDDIAARYELDPADIKQVREDTTNAALAEFESSGDPTAYVRLLKAAPDDIAPSLKATLSKGMTQLMTINPEEISKMSNDDPRLNTIKQLKQLGEVTDDYILKSALGDKYLDFVSFRMDAQTGNYKYALSELKQRQDLDFIGSTAAKNHHNWSRLKSNALNSALSDVAPDQADLMRPYLELKISEFGKRFNPARAEEMLKQWVGLRKTFDYEGETVLFGERVVADTESFRGEYDVDEEFVYGKYHEYALQTIQKKYGDVSEISLVPSPNRPDWFLAVAPSGQYIDNNLIHAQVLRKAFLSDPTVKTKLKDAADNVRANR